MRPREWIHAATTLTPARRDALRMGLQSAVAAGGVYLVMHALDLPEVYVGTLSAVLILSVSADASVGAGIDRMLATVVGSGIAIVSILILPDGWGTAAALALTMAAMGALATLRPNWQYGLVAATAISLGADDNVFDITVDRLIAIALGVAIGIAVSVAVWPERATKRYRRHRRAALRALIDRLDRLENATVDDVSPVSGDADRKYHDAYGLLVAAKGAKPFGKTARADEEIHRIRRIYNSIVMLDRALEVGDHDVRDYQPTIHAVRARLVDLLDRDLEPHCNTDGDSPPIEDHRSDPESVLRFGLHALSAELTGLEDLHR
ncbi:MAG: FUSC family protein [Pseudomonadota bacterium]